MFRCFSIKNLFHFCFSQNFLHFRSAHLENPLNQFEIPFISETFTISTSNYKASFMHTRNLNMKCFLTFVKKTIKSLKNTKKKLSRRKHLENNYHSINEYIMHRQSWNILCWCRNFFMIFIFGWTSQALPFFFKHNSWILWRFNFIFLFAVSVLCLFTLLHQVNCY